MVRRSLLLVAGHRAFTQDVAGGVTLAQSRCGQFALYGADGRGRRFRVNLLVLCRLCTRLYRLYGLPRLLSRLSGGGGHSCTSLRVELRLAVGLDRCLGMRWEMRMH